MTNARDFLGTLPIFAEMTPEEVAICAELVTKEETFEPGEVIYSEGDPPAGMYIVVEGAVEVLGVFPGGVERVVGTHRKGDIFGWLALIDKLEQHGTARAAEKTRTLQLEEPAFDVLEEKHPAIYRKIIAYFLDTMAGYMRGLVEQYKSAVEWNLEVSGLTGMSLGALLKGDTDVTVQLRGGESLRGRIVKLDQSMAGHELLFRCGADEVHIIPYHSISRISTDTASVPGPDGTQEF